MADKNKISLNNLDNYINTFKIKSFDSDDEDDIFSTKPKTKSPKNEVNDYVIVKSEPQSQKVPDSFYSNVEDLDASDNLIIYQKKESPIKEQIIQKKDIYTTNKPEEKPKGSFTNIYNNFNKVLNNKVDIFSNDALDQEINNIGNDNIYNTNTNVEQTKYDNYNNQCDINHDNYNNDYNNIYSNDYSNNYNNHNDYLIQEQTLNKESEFKNEKTAINNKNKNYQSVPGITAKFNFNKALIFNSKHSKIVITNYSTRLNDLDSLLSKDYFPLSYSQKIDVSNMKQMFNALLTKILRKEIKKVSLSEYITVNVLNNFFENNLRCDLLDINNSYKRKEIYKNFQSLKINVKDNTQYNNISFSKLFHEDTSETSYSLKFLFENSMENLLVNCYEKLTPQNFAFFSIFAKKEDIYNYISAIFEQSPTYKTQDFYIIFMLKSGKISKLIKERTDYLYMNFYSFIFIILTNFDMLEETNISLFLNSLLKAESEYKTLDKMFILKLLLNNFTYQKNENLANKKYVYSKYMTEFIHSTSYYRLLVADLFSYFLYSKANEKDDKILSEIGYCSILIKFKYFLLSKYDSPNQESLNEFGKKIFEFSSQFGEVAKNKAFLNSIQEILLANQNINVNKEKRNNSNIQANKVIVKTPILFGEERNEAKQIQSDRQQVLYNV